VGTLFEFSFAAFNFAFGALLLWLVDSNSIQLVQMPVPLIPKGSHVTGEGRNQEDRDGCN